MSLIRTMWNNLGVAGELLAFLKFRGQGDREIRGQGDRGTRGRRAE